MRTVNIHEAKTHLSRLVDQAARGEPFIIAKSGKAMVKVAVDMVGEGKLTPRDAVLRIDPAKLDEVLHPTIDPKARPPAIANPSMFVPLISSTLPDAFSNPRGTLYCRNCL